VEGCLDPATKGRRAIAGDEVAIATGPPPKHGRRLGRRAGWEEGSSKRGDAPTADRADRGRGADTGGSGEKGGGRGCRGGI
jgi:hypothetical protein